MLTDEDIEEALESGSLPGGNAAFAVYKRDQKRKKMRNSPKIPENMIYY